MQARGCHRCLDIGDLGLSRPPSDTTWWALRSRHSSPPSKGHGWPLEPSQGEFAQWDSGMMERCFNSVADRRLRGFPRVDGRLSGFWPATGVQKTRVSNPGRVRIRGRFFPHFPISRNSFAKAIRWRSFALIEASSGLIGLRLPTHGPNQWVATGFSAVGEGFCSSRGKATPVRYATVAIQ
jgi:hypothetical protein